MTAEQDPVDRVIDRAARQLTSGNPSDRLTADVLSRIEQSGLEPSLRPSGSWGPGLSWQVATLGVVAVAIVLLLFVSRQTGPRPISSEGSDGVSTDRVARDGQTLSLPDPKEAADPVALETKAPTEVAPTVPLRPRESEPFPAVPPIEIRSINLGPIETPGIEIARLEISPIRLDPVEPIRQETP
jgi:hypothetical protein